MDKKNYDVYGLAVYVADDGNEYAVGTDKQANKAAYEAAYQSLWAFRPSYILGHLPISGRAAELAEIALENMQSNLSEDAAPIIELLLGKKLRSFLVDAIDADGRGHFLNQYDGEEYDSDDIPGLPRGKFAYRQ